MGGGQTDGPPLHDKGANSVLPVVAGIIGDDVQPADTRVGQSAAELVGRAHVGEAADHDGLAIVEPGQRLFQRDYFRRCQKNTLPFVLPGLPWSPKF